MQVEVDVNACKPILVGVASPVLELWLLLTCLRVEVDVNACKPILVGVASPVSELWLLIVHGGQKIELAQKIHASRG